MSRWILNFPVPENPQVTLFCLPYAGSGAAAFRPWCELLAPEIRLVGIQLPGRENRMDEPPETSFAPLLGPIIQTIEDVGAPSFALFGHSMGAHLAFAVARQMRAEQKKMPDHMILSGRRPVHLDVDAPKLAGLSDQEFLDEVTKRGGPQTMVAPEILEFMLPTSRADVAATEGWPTREEPPLDIDATIIGGDDDGWVDPETLARWLELFATAPTLRIFPGDHFYLHMQSADVVAFLKKRLLG